MNRFVFVVWLLVAMSSTALGQQSKLERSTGSSLWAAYLETLRQQPRQIQTTTGLSLKLETSIATGTTNTINFRARLANVGNYPVQLTHTNRDYGQGPADYQAYFMDAIRIEVDPEISGPTFGTGGAIPVPRIMTYELGVGETLTAEWREKCGRTGPYNLYRKWLVEPGRYHLTVHYLAQVTGYDDVSYELSSDPVPLDFGGSANAPDLTLTEVVEVDNVTKTVVLGAGSENGVQVGEEWYIQFGKGYGWKIVITVAGLRRARAEFASDGVSKTEAFDGALNFSQSPLKIGQRAARADSVIPPECEKQDLPGAELPGPAQILTRFRSFIAEHGHWVIFGLILFFLIFYVFRWRKLGKY